MAAAMVRIMAPPFFLYVVVLARRRGAVQVAKMVYGKSGHSISRWPQWKCPTGFPVLPVKNIKINIHSVTLGQNAVGDSRDHLFVVNRQGHEHRPRVNRGV
jgi:hypothetical protein